jgi:hypothetical protein
MDATIEFCATKSEADALCNRLNSELEDAEIAEINVQVAKTMPDRVRPSAADTLAFRKRVDEARQRKAEQETNRQLKERLTDGSSPIEVDFDDL